MRKCWILISFILAGFPFYSSENSVTLTFIRADAQLLISFNTKPASAELSDYRFTDYSDLNNMIRFDFKKQENMIRRAEIIFFGSLTIVSFVGWLSFSIYNMMIYGDSFGTLRREQFLTLYFGSGILSLSVAVSDIIAQLAVKNKKLDFK